MNAVKLAEKTIQWLTDIHLHIVRQNQAPPPTIENRNPEPKFGYLLSFSNREDVKEKWEKYAKGLFFSEVFQVVEAFCSWYRDQYIIKGKV